MLVGDNFFDKFFDKFLCVSWWLDLSYWPDLTKFFDNFFDYGKKKQEDNNG